MCIAIFTVVRVIREGAGAKMELRMCSRRCPVATHGIYSSSCGRISFYGVMLCIALYTVDGFNVNSSRVQPGHMHDTMSFLYNCYLPQRRSVDVPAAVAANVRLIFSNFGMNHHWKALEKTIYSLQPVGL